MYAPGDGVTKGLGSFGLMWSEGALGSSLPVISKQTCWIIHFGINQTSKYLISRHAIEQVIIKD